MSSSDLDLMMAEQFYFIAHDDRAGRRRLHPRAVALGLAAALLGELVLRGCVDVRGGAVIVLRREAPTIPVLRNIVDDMLQQPQHRDVAVWLAYLAEVAPDAVEARLERAGFLRGVRHRRLTGSHVTYEPVDVNQAAWQSVRVEQFLNRRERLLPQDAFLAGLVDATGLTWHVLWDRSTSAGGLAHLPRVISGLWPSLGELVSYTRAAVGQTVLAPR